MSDQFFLDTLVIKDSLKSELRLRSKAFYEATISKKKFPLYESEGWYSLRENENSHRARLDKSIFEQVEDEVWSLLANLGFHELNKNREFRVRCGENSVRKIDVFARDDETALIVECTTAEVPGKRKSMTGLIDKIKSYREDIVKAVHGHYGDEFRPKFGWIIATRNIAWSDQDIERAGESDVTVLRDEDLDYFAELQKHIKTAARFQFLASIFEGKSIKGLNTQVPATRGKMGGTEFFTFLITPEQLMKISYIGHKNSRGPESIETYQRMLKSKRLKDISFYINNGGKFPTNIVVNLQSKKTLEFKGKDEIGGLTFGELSLPNRYASAWVIDGQHRLYGYALSDRAEDSVVPVLAFVNLPPEQQKELFVDINHKQVKVPRGLLLDIYSELHWGSDDPEEALTSLCSKVTKVLGADANSPLRNRIVIGEQKKTSHRCLTITTIASALKKEQLLGSVNQYHKVILPAALGNEKLHVALRRAVSFLELYLSDFRDAMPEQWELGDAKGGYVCTNNALVALLKVLRAIFSVLENKNIDVRHVEIDELHQYVSEYSTHLIEWMSALEEEKISSLRSKVGSKGQIAVAWEMMQAIHEKDGSFEPPGLTQWMASFDKEGTRLAKRLVDDIQLALYKSSLALLKDKYGDKWWYEGVPLDIRKKCAQRVEDEGGKFEADKYLDLIDYKSIASSNWANHFQLYYSVGDKQSKKDTQLNWLVKLNDIRKTVSHPARGLLTKKDVDFVKYLKDEIHPKLQDFWPK